MYRDVDFGGDRDDDRDDGRAVRYAMAAAKSARALSSDRISGCSDEPLEPEPALCVIDKVWKTGNMGWTVKRRSSERQHIQKGRRNTSHTTNRTHLNQRRRRRPSRRLRSVHGRLAVVCQHRCRAVHAGSGTGHRLLVGMLRRVQRRHRRRPHRSKR